jgi:hypothetical protein
MSFNFEFEKQPCHLKPNILGYLIYGRRMWFKVIGRSFIFKTFKMNLFHALQSLTSPLKINANLGVSKKGTRHD